VNPTRATIAATLLCLTMACAARGRAAEARGPGAGRATAGEAPDVTAAERPAALREVAFDQHLGAQLPLDLVFRDENGAAVPLGSLLSARPVLMQLAYYQCPMLCPLVLNGLTSSLKPLTFDVGRDFDVVVVSIAPDETTAQAAEKRRSAIARYARPGTDGGWHFLTGSPEAIRRLSEAVGFRYAFDETTRQYAHAAGVVLLTPGGRISRYFFGAEFSSRDLRLGLIESTQRKIGTLADQLLLFCFHYDPANGRYTATALSVVRLGGVLTVLALIGFVALSLRRELVRGRSAAAPGSRS
jgi:protein SCO1